MARKSLRLGGLVLPAVVLTFTIVGIAAASKAHSTDDTAADLPLSCEIAVSKGRYGQTYEARVHADSAVSGSYRLSLSKSGAGGSAMISQSGDFALGAGDSETVGQATFGGVPSSVDAELILRWNGIDLRCPGDLEI